MEIPFTIDQFLGIFETYNLAIWPAQIFAYILGGLAIVLAIKKNNYSDYIISTILFLFWIWMGIAYHITYFSSINKLAYLFGVFFIIQGLLFLWFGIISPKLSFFFYPEPGSIIGAIFLLYAMVIYPILGYYLGHIYPKAPVFGVAPCPVTFFTFGLLLWSDKKIPLFILLVPVLWSFIGFNAALFLGVKEDFGLLIAAILGSILVILSNQRKQIKA